MKRFQCCATPSLTANRCATTISREIFEKILENEEEHVDWLETQFEMMERMGLENYVQLQSKSAGGEE